MARFLCLEFAGAFYHVTARGDRQDHFFLKHSDRRKIFVHLNKEVTQLGDDQYLERMKALVDGKVVQGIIKAHRTPKRPHPEEIEIAVRRAYGNCAGSRLESPEADWVAIYLLRWVDELSLREVAGPLGVSAARIFQNRTKMEQGRTRKQALPVFRHYKRQSSLPADPLIKRN